MQVARIDNTIFTSKKITTFNALWRLTHDPKFTNIKPVKTYGQYLKTYGLDIKAKKQ